MTAMRFAFIGVRGHYEWVLRALHALPSHRVSGICDGGAEPAESLLRVCRELGHEPEQFSSHHEMLNIVRPDAVVICGPLDDFIAHIQGRRSALINADDSLATTAACLLARESADQGQSVSAEAFTSIPMKSKLPAVVRSVESYGRVELPLWQEQV